MASLSCSDELSALHDYEVEELIGTGSMARVYRARRREDGTLVALKVPLPQVMNNAVLRERFRAEYRVGSSLNHPNIVRTLDFGEESNTFYLVMELVDGTDLWKRITTEGRLPEAEAVDLVSQAAQGLHEAHRNGIIHRDVKPDNILLTREGRAKLGDLGLLKDLESEAALTCPDKGLGTPNFIAPEQFTGADQADVRCDVYSLGATLYMAVTGTLPFDGKNVATVLRRKLNNDLRSPQDIVPALSDAVSWAIRRALQVDPRVRQATCLEFIQSLRGEKAAVPVAPSQSQGGRRPRPSQERRGAVRYACTLATVCEVHTSIHEAEGQALEPWPAQVVNLSIRGIGLVIDRRFEPGTIVSTQLEAPDQGFRCRVDLCVQRCIRAGAGKWFLGASFHQPLAREDLRQLV